VYEVHGNSSDKLSTPEVLIAELAAPQHGVVTIAQLLAAGLDRDAVAYRRKVGRLHLLHRGVYAVGHRPPSRLAGAMAAVLACGPDAALSHRPAGALWKLLPRSTKPEVIARSDRRQKGIHVTTPLRTLVDLADILPPKQLTRAPNEAQVQRRVTAAELSTLLTRYPGRRTAQLTPERSATRSAEDRFIRFLKRHKLPLPEHDRDRDADLLNAGFPTVRITDHRLRRHATKEAARLACILSGGL
jgi:hypothetical protein